MNKESSTPEVQPTDLANKLSEASQLIELSNQLSKIGSLIYRIAAAQKQSASLSAVLSPDGVFYGDDWPKRFKWHIDRNFELVGELLEGEVNSKYQSQLAAIYANGYGENRNAMEALSMKISGCKSYHARDRASITLSEAGEYLPFMKKHNLQVETIDITEESMREEEAFARNRLLLMEQLLAQKVKEDTGAK